MLPLLIGAAAAPVVGGLIKGAAGVGRNEAKTPSFGDSSQYDPYAQYYAGSPTGRRDYTANMSNRRAEIDERGTPQANYGQANEWDSRAALMRGNQGAAANLMMNRATGAVPSIASQQAALDTQRMQAAQQAQAASARGAAGIAGAHRNAAYAQASGGAQISNNAQINAANERLAAERAAYEAYSGIRHGDTQAAGEQARRAEFAVGSEFQNRGINDTRAMGYEDLEARANEAELRSRAVNQGNLAGSFNTAATSNAQRNQNNANWANNNWDSMGSGMKGGGGGGAPVPGRASGGPVDAGRPYIVGERGPELIVPQKSGMVLPNNVFNQVLRLQRGGAPARPAPRPAPSPRLGPNMNQMLDDRQRQYLEKAPAVEDTSQLQSYLSDQGERDLEDLRISRMVEEQRQKDARAVQAHRAKTDEDGQAPGQSDWDKFSGDSSGGKVRKEGSFRYTRGKGVSEEKSPERPDGGDDKANKTLDAVNLLRKGFFGGYRASGGPVSGGIPYIVGEGGPEVLLQGAGAPAGATSFDKLDSGGGMDVNASYKAHSDFGTRFGGSPGASPIGYREEGGPVEEGKPYVVGEKGPELYVAPPIASTLPPPRPPPIQATEETNQFASPNEQAVYDYARTMQGTSSTPKPSYDIAATIRREPSYPFVTPKAHETPGIDIEKFKAALATVLKESTSKKTSTTALSKGRKR